MVIFLLGCASEPPAPEAPTLELAPIAVAEPAKPDSEEPWMVFEVQHWHTASVQDELEAGLDTRVRTIQAAILTACTNCQVTRTRTRFTEWPTGLNGLAELRVTLSEVGDAPDVLGAAKDAGAALDRARLAY